jgi:DNA-binding transcriptional regulator YbjK
MTSEGRRRGPGRPHAASREAVEQIALALMLRDGYDAVSVDAIASEAGIGRTTFFRYFGSKHGVIWAPFDATLAWMEESLHAVDRDDDPLTAVRKAVVSSTRASGRATSGSSASSSWTPIRRSAQRRTNTGNGGRPRSPATSPVVRDLVRVR